MSKEKNKGGRPFSKIDWKKLDSLCAKQCTLVEVSETLGVSEDTVERAIKREKNCGFAEYFAVKRKKGIAKLRTKQFDMAIKGDKTMLVWLGKQYLQQRDKQEHSGPDGGPMQVRTLSDFYADPKKES